MAKTLNIDEEYLSELIGYVSRGLVGKLMKRFEIIEDRETLKLNAKELVYEELRNFKELLTAHNKGMNLTQIVFKTKGSPTT